MWVFLHQKDTIYPPNTPPVYKHNKMLLQSFQPNPVYKLISQHTHSFLIAPSPHQ